MRARGFTLIELLVVIAIIGMLASIVLSSVYRSKIEANDTVRVSNIREIKKAIYVAYPDLVTTNLPRCSDPGYVGGCESVVLSDGTTAFFDSSRDGNFMEFLRPHIATIGHGANDVGSNFYFYGRGEWPVGSGDIYKYFIGVVLENSSNPALKQSLNFNLLGYEKYYVLGEK